SWADPNKRLSCIKKFFTSYSNEEGYIGDTQIRRSFKNALIEFSEFNPIAVIGIITLLKEKFGLDTTAGIHMLDTSAGWGGRLVGALADQRVMSYTGFDPNTKMREAYSKLSEIYSEQSTTAVRMFCKPSEELTRSDIEKDVDGSSGFSSQFDLLLTSPPYWNTEKYSNEPTQSWKRYPDLTDWTIDYLFQTLFKAASFLKIGGFAAINIADVRKEKQIKGKVELWQARICEPMLQFLTNNLQMDYLGCVAYPIGSKNEPMWLLRKTCEVQTPFNRDSLLLGQDENWKKLEKKSSSKKDMKRKVEVFNKENPEENGVENFKNPISAHWRGALELPSNHLQL
ncbi:MAG: hypothetical protein K940chlam7_01879, partial [Chlamydiae bacterium]|nr:hypothetical protein [Chlamydiota bacterium]